MPENGTPKKNKRQYRSRLTPEQRRMQAQMAALIRWAYTDDKTRATEPARRAARDRFERQVDPEFNLSAEERGKRARAAEMAHMKAMSLASSKLRKPPSKRSRRQ